MSYKKLAQLIGDVWCIFSWSAALQMPHYLFLTATKTSVITALTDNKNTISSKSLPILILFSVFITQPIWAGFSQHVV